MKRALPVHLPAAILAVALLMPFTTAADDALQMSGFGTLGVSWFSSDEVDLVSNIAPRGPGRSSSVDFGLDSRLGVQLDYAFGPATTATLQLVSERNADGNFTPQVSLANLRYEFNPNLNLRLGRLQTPAFLAAEHRLVGFAIPWARPPIPVYGIFPLAALDGIDVAYRDSVAGGTLTLRAGLFGLETEVARSNDAASDLLEAEQGGYVRMDLDKGAWRGTATLSRVKGSYSTPTLQGALGYIEYVLGDADSASALALDESPVTLATLGVAREDADWLFMAEWVSRYTDNAIPDAWGAYATLGRRFGDSMPYVTLGRRKTGGPNVASNVSDPVARATVNAVIQQLADANNFDQWTLSLGLSQRLRDDTLLKLQWDVVKPDKGSWGPYLNHSPAYDPSDPHLEHLISVNLDFIF